MPTPKELLEQGIGFANEGMWEDAIDAFIQAIELSDDQKYPGASYSLGIVYCNLKEHGLAIEAFQIAIEDSFDQKFPKAFFYLGCVYYLENRPELAIQSFQKAIADSIDQKYPIASYNLGLVYKYLNEHALAIEAYKKAIADSINQKYPIASYNLGLVYMCIDESDLEVRSYLKAIEDSKDKKFPNASLNLGNVYFNSHQHKLAIQAYLKAIEDSKNQKFPQATLYLGNVYSSINQPELAEQAYKKAIKDTIDHYFPDCWFRLSEAQTTLGKLLEARDAAFTAITQDSDSLPIVHHVLDHFVSESAEQRYKNRAAYLELLQWLPIAKSEAYLSVKQKAFLALSEESPSSLYAQILLRNDDYLALGYERIERLRLAYLIFASLNQYHWVYYIIDRMVDTDDHVLNAMDKVFFLKSAIAIGQPRSDIKLFANEVDPALVLKELDPYMADVSWDMWKYLVAYSSRPPEQTDLLLLIKSEKPFIPKQSQHELLAIYLSKFENKIAKTESDEKKRFGLLTAIEFALTKSKEGNSLETAHLNHIGNCIHDLLTSPNTDKLILISAYLSKLQVLPEVHQQQVSDLRIYAMKLFNQLKINEENREKFKAGSLVLGYTISELAGVVAAALPPAIIIAYGLPWVFDKLKKSLNYRFFVGKDLTWEYYLETKSAEM